MSTPPNENNPQWGSPEAQGSQPEPAGPYSGAQPAAQTGSKFGTAGYDPGANYNAPMNEPRQYSLLKTMTLASFGLYLLSGILGLIPMFTGEAEDLARTQLEGQDLAGMSVDDALAIGMTTAWVIILVPLVISVVVYLLVYFGLRATKNWARITGVVFAIIGLLVTLGSMGVDPSAYTSGFGIVALIITVAWAAVSIYWLVLAFSSPVRDYIAQSRM